MNQPTYTSQRTYAQSTQFPNRNQAIVIHAADVSEEIKLKDYIYEVGKHVGPSNIIFASRISNNRVCMYLKSSTLADQLPITHPIIHINNTNLKVRKLINPAKRIIISNVSPHIPHEIIENALNNIHIKTTSPVTFMRVGQLEEEYKHIHSFRRQVYTTSDNEDEDTQNIPPTIVIQYQEENFRIFLSTEDHWCPICKTAEHSANSCNHKRTEIAPKHPITKRLTANPHPTPLAEDIVALNHNALEGSNLNLEDSLLDHDEKSLNKQKNETDTISTPSTQQQLNDTPNNSNPSDIPNSLPEDGNGKRPLSAETSPTQSNSNTSSALKSPKPPNSKKNKTEHDTPAVSIQQAIMPVKSLSNNKRKLSPIV